MVLTIEPTIEQSFRTFLDPVNFCEAWLKLESPEGFIDWLMDGYQKYLIRDISRNRIINKSKKTGISTTIAGESIHKTFSTPGKQIMFVSTGQRIAEELLGKWYDLVKTMPDCLQPRFDKRSMDTARLPNGSRVMSLPSSDPAKIRGLGLRGGSTDVYVDEYAHVDNDSELWLVCRDFQIIGGAITLNSTPKGKRGKFYEISDPLQSMFRGKIKHDPFHVWTYHEILYTDCPRLAKQEKQLKASVSDIDFQQEYRAEFIDESLSFFPYELLEPNQSVTSFVDSDYQTKNLVQMGIDFGKTTSETIVYISEKVAPEKWKTLYIEEFTGVNYEAQVESIFLLAKAYRVTLVNIDASGPGGQVMNDLLSSERRLGHKVVPYDLTSSTKENIIIRMRILLQGKRFMLPAVKNVSDYFLRVSEKLQTQLHGVMRTTTDAGLHTRYSGKETAGMDDMVWAAALSVYEPYEYSFDTFVSTTQDTTLAKMMKERKMDEQQETYFVYADDELDDEGGYPHLW